MSPKASSISAEQVTAYLEQHPLFFQGREDLLPNLEIPHIEGNSISLVERQVIKLRQEKSHLQQKLQVLIEAAQRNENLNVQIQTFLLALLSAQTLPEFFDTLYAKLAEEFDTDAVVLRLFDLPEAAKVQRSEYVEYDAEIFSLFEMVLKKSYPVCGRLSANQHQYLMPDQKIGSAVLIPIGRPSPYGLLALGSVDDYRFDSQMSTDLLSYMGDMISQLLQRWHQHL